MVYITEIIHRAGTLKFIPVVIYYVQLNTPVFEYEVIICIVLQQIWNKLCVLDRFYFLYL